MNNDNHTNQCRERGLGDCRPLDTFIDRPDGVSFETEPTEVYPDIVGHDRQRYSSLFILPRECHQWIQGPAHEPTELDIIQTIMQFLQQVSLQEQQRILEECLRRSQATGPAQAMEYCAPDSTLSPDQQCSLQTMFPHFGPAETIDGCLPNVSTYANASEEIPDLNTGASSSRSVTAEFVPNAYHANRPEGERLSQQPSLGTLTSAKSTDQFYMRLMGIHLGTQAVPAVTSRSTYQRDFPSTRGQPLQPLSSHQACGRTKRRKELVICGLDGCQRKMSKDSIRRHRKEFHFRQRRKKP